MVRVYVFRISDLICDFDFNCANLWFRSVNLLIKIRNELKSLNLLMSS